MEAGLGLLQPVSNVNKIWWVKYSKYIEMSYYVAYLEISDSEFDIATEQILSN